MISEIVKQIDAWGLARSLYKDLERAEPSKILKRGYLNSIKCCDFQIDELVYRFSQIADTKNFDWPLFNR